VKAWNLVAYRTPLALQEIPDPVPEPGEVLIDVKACGLCHSDVSIINGDYAPLFPAKWPIVKGHEIAGVITALGAGVTGFGVGDRVAVHPLVADLNSRDGGYAYQAVMPAESLVRIPGSVSYEHAAISTDAGMTSYHAVHVRGAVQAGMAVGIIGLGGLGMLGARFAVLAGAEVYAAEPNAGLHAAATGAGVREVRTDISEFADENLEVIVDFAGFGATTAAAIETVKPYGRVVQVGLGKPEATINTLRLCMKRVDLLGSLGGTVEDLADVLGLFAAGELSPPITRISFDEIPEGLARLEAGGSHGRLVVDYEGASSAQADHAAEVSS